MGPLESETGSWVCSTYQPQRAVHAQGIMAVALSFRFPSVSHCDCQLPALPSFLRVPFHGHQSSCIRKPPKIRSAGEHTHPSDPQPVTVTISD